MRVIARLLSLGKWLLLGLVLLEVASFIAISIQNYIVYGHVWEGARVRYDPHALFLHTETPRRTAHNPPASDDGSVRRIWFFGGSTARGWGTDYTTSIPSLLAKRLNGNGDGPKFELVNYGQDAFNSLLESKLFQGLIADAKARPNTVLFYDGGNDSTYLAQYRNPNGHFRFRRMQALVEGYRDSPMGLFKGLNAAFYGSSMREIWDRTHQVLLPLDPEGPLLAAYLDKLEHRYDHLNRLAGAYGAQFLVIWQPSRWTETCAVDKTITQSEGELPGSALTAYRGNLKTIYRAVIARLAGKPYFRDLSQTLCARTRPAYRKDGLHLLPNGRRMMSDKIAAELAGTAAAGQ